ncbi:unnamed protein product [Schistosoma margrebowiei]|uniref:Ig-like domain-containing protein n=1 Tax=Schistosoma margrebowiei TaxID=48269 RepID=A0AA84ZSR5_9TREM|nr:unnamed protein product [Schistosoma margrebowiei]
MVVKNMKMYIKCRVCLCISLFFCTYFVNNIVSSEFMEIHNLPKFIMEPMDRIYYSSNHPSQFITKLQLYALITPKNATIQLGAVHKDKPNMIIYLPTVIEYSTESYSMTFAQTHAKIQSISLNDHLNDLSSYINHFDNSNSNGNNNNNIKENINLWSITVYNFLPDMKLLVLATTNYGTITSHLIDLKTSVLPAFPPHSDKYLSLLIGNTAIVICHLPLSQPSLPTVHFYHNNIRLDLTQTDRYRLIYIGGDDSGLPWEVRSHKPHFRQEHLKKYKPSAVILLIHSLQLSDTGQYYCSVSLFDKTISSNQRTHLVVTKPNEKIRTHLKFSSDDPDLSYLYNTNNEINSNTLTNHNNNNDPLNTIKEIEINENTNLTLFCIFESAPVVSTRWYYDGFMENIEINQKFGVLIIKYARLENQGIYTCSVDNSHSKLIGKSFRIIVKRSPITSSLNPKVIITESGKQVTLNCNNNNNNNNTLQNNNMMNKHKIPFPMLPTLDEWNKWDFNKRINNSKYHMEKRYNNKKLNYSPYINQWIHNGQFITMNEIKNNNYHFEDGLLKILKIAKSDTGIYQYMKSTQYTNSIDANSNENEYDSESVNCKFYIQLNDEKFVHNETDEQIQTIYEHTAEGLTGHLNCNLSSLLLIESYQNNNQLNNQYQWSILWYRSVTSNEPLNIESVNKASGGIKYIISNVNEYTQILSIVNPRKITDDGQYICRVYNTTTGKLLGEQRFQLIIESNNDEDTHKNLMKHESFMAKSLSSIPSEIHSQYELPIKRNENEFVLKQTIHHHEKPQIKVSRPIVKRLANFTMAVHIKWTVYNSPMKELHYQLGVKHLGNIRQTKSIMTYSNEYLNLKNKSNTEEFSVLPNIYDNSSIIFDSRDLFQPQNSYSLRVLVLEHQLWSPWTEPVNFDNMLDTNLQIISIVANNNTCLYIEWIYIQSRNHSYTSIDITNFKDLTFIIIYRNLSENLIERKSLLELWTKFTLNDDKQFPMDLSKINHLGDLYIRRITSDSSLKSYLLDGLQSNVTYAVSVYIEVTKIDHYQHQKYFTRLSNEAVQKTLPNITSSLNNEYTFLANNSTNENINKMADSFVQSTSNIKSKMIEQIGHKNDLTSKLTKSYQHDSYVLIVILGSLAGVLLIIFIVLITFCIWYRLHLKSRYPRGYFGGLSDSQLTETPKQRTITEWENFQSQPISTTDNHQTFPRTTGNLHLQSLGDQQNLITDMNNFATLQHPTQWIQQSQVPCESNCRKSMVLDDTLKTYWPIINSNEAKVAFMKNHNHENVIHSSPLLPLYKDYLLKQTKHQSINGTFSDGQVGNQIGSLDGIFQDVTVGEQFNGANKLSNKDNQLTNDQSSSIYSHIDSDSTVNELSQFHLDRFNSTLSPTTPSDYSGIGKTILNSLQNNNLNNRKEISRDCSQPTSLSYAANSIYPFIIKPDDLVSLPLIGHQGMNTNDPNSFYTTVPPLRHIHPYLFNENQSINQSDQYIINQLKIPINQYNNNNNNMIIQQSDLIKHLQLLNKNQFIYGSNILNTLTTTPLSTYTDNLTATLTLQQWIEYMSKPELINNNNNMKLYNELYKKLENKSNIKQSNIQFNKIEKYNVCNDNKQYHKSPRENLSSSFADSGVDLPNTNNLESDIMEHNLSKNDSPIEIRTRTSNIIRPIERVSSGP